MNKPHFGVRLLLAVLSKAGTLLLFRDYLCYTEIPQLLRNPFTAQLFETHCPHSPARAEE